MLLAALCCLPCNSHGAEYSVPLMAEAPTIDGKIKPAEWNRAFRIDGFAANGVLEPREATAYIGATASTICLAIRSQLPDEGTLVSDVRRNGDNVVYDDSIEVWVDPSQGQKAGRQFQVIVNSNGFHVYKLHPYGGALEDPTWRGNWKIANALHDGVWDCEIEIPVADLTPNRHADDGTWGINLCRNWKQDWAWSSLGGVTYAPTDTFSFTTQPGPIVALERHGNVFHGDVHPSLILRNPGPAPLRLHYLLQLDRDLMPQIKNEEAIDLAANESRTISIDAVEQATRKYVLSARVSDDGDKSVLFSRTIAWSAGGPSRWIVHKKPTPPIACRFAYYPYQNRLRVAVDISRRPAGSVVHSVVAVVRKGEGTVLKSVVFKRFIQDRQEIDIPLPPLRGSYEIAFRPSGRGVATTEVVQRFERTRFPWEHNTLGLSHRVYAPFTPIVLNHGKLSTVLRDHLLGSTGLWNQVSARGKMLLAGPMRWEANVDGKPVAVRSDDFKIVSYAGDRAVTKARFHAAALQGQAVSTWDYDGAMRCDLTLSAPKGRLANALTLIIPLKDEAASLYHAMGDGIRNTLYSEIPTGNGAVWSAAKVQASDIPANFCTYLYVGTPVRGLCWFAENDHGWGWDPSTPNIELVRTQGVVEMRVHLINRPTQVSAPRTMTFGLLAAPVKPRLAADWRYKYRRDKYTVLGTDINWLALGDCGSVYPAGRDMTLWQMIAKGNREHLSDATIQSVVERGTPYFAPYGKDKIDMFQNHVRYNLRSRYGKKMIFYYNRASYQAAEEFETFKDEWDLTDLRSIEKGASRDEIKIVPTTSYIDHALYWYGKSFDIGGNRGVYWDNWFFVPSYNTAMTAAYRKPDNAVVPATGLWGMRELAKRTFQYMNERGMPPITMPHMTSTGILPLLSFATLQYDWEWKYSEGDVQDRFPRDYILLVTDGELAGTWPVLLADQGKLADDPWTARTFAAVSILHELDCSYSEGTASGKMQNALFQPIDAILRAPGVQITRYWDERVQPIKTTDPDLPTITYSVKGKEAVFAIVSYAGSDEMADIHIDPHALGFAGPYRILDTETGQEIPQTNDRIALPIRKHDLHIFRLTPTTLQ